MSEPVDTRAEIQKPFGLWSATCLVAANMIGAGVFTTSGLSLADLGDRRYVMIAWLIGGVIAICGAISYGQLVRRIAESGGEYLFLSRWIHPSVGFMAGWVSLLAGFTGAIAFAATAFEFYAIPESFRPAWFQPGMAGIGVILLFGLLHSLVLRIGVWAQNVIVVAKMVLLAIFVGFAFSEFPAGWAGMQVATAPADGSLYAIAATLVWISLSFSGFNAAVYVTGEVEDPTHNVPRALLLGTVVVTLVYVALNAIFLFGDEPGRVSGAPDVAAVAAKAIGGDGLAVMIRVIVSVSLLTSVSSMLIAGPRVYTKMASDGVFPGLFASSRRGQLEVPATAIWLQMILASAVCYASTIRSLLDYLGFTLSVSSALTVVCILRTRRLGESGASRGLFSVVALAYVGATMGLATLSAVGRPQQLVGFAVTVGSGMLLYRVFRWSAHSRPGQGLRKV